MACVLRDTVAPHPCSSLPHPTRTLRASIGVGPAGSPAYGVYPLRASVKYHISMSKVSVWRLGLEGYISSDLGVHQHAGGGDPFDHASQAGARAAQRHAHRPPFQHEIPSRRIGRFRVGVGRDRVVARLPGPRRRRPTFSRRMLQPVSLARSTSLPRSAGNDSSSTVRASILSTGQAFRRPGSRTSPAQPRHFVQNPAREQSLLFVTSGTYDIDKRQYQHKSYNKRSGYND